MTIIEEYCENCTYCNIVYEKSNMPPCCKHPANRINEGRNKYESYPLVTELMLSKCKLLNYRKITPVSKAVRRFVKRYNDQTPYIKQE